MVKGNTITLDSGVVYNINDLLKVPDDAPSTGKNAIDKEKAETDAMNTRTKQVNANRFKKKRENLRKFRSQIKPLHNGLKPYSIW